MPCTGCDPIEGAGSTAAAKEEEISLNQRLSDGSSPMYHSLRLRQMPAQILQIVHCIPWLDASMVMPDNDCLRSLEDKDALLVGGIWTFLCGVMSASGLFIIIS